MKICGLNFIPYDLDVCDLERDFTWESTQDKGTWINFCLGPSEFLKTSTSQTTRTSSIQTHNQLTAKSQWCKFVGWISQSVPANVPPSPGECSIMARLENLDNKMTELSKVLNCNILWFQNCGAGHSLKKLSAQLTWCGSCMLSGTPDNLDPEIQSFEEVHAELFTNLTPPPSA